MSQRGIGKPSLPGWTYWQGCRAMTVGVLLWQSLPRIKNPCQIDRPYIFAHNYAIIMYKGGDDMPQIRPITDLRNTNEISDLCHARREPVFITKNGYGDLVVMSIETYEALVENAAIDAAISDAEAELEYSKQLHDAQEALASLRRKHFG